MAGILLVLAFAATAFTLTQMADLEKRSAQEEQAPIFSFYRDLRARMYDMLYTGITTSTTTATFGGPFDRARAYLQDLSHGQSYETVIELAGASQGHARTEWSFTDLGYPFHNNASDVRDYSYPRNENADKALAKYFVRSYDGKVKLEPGMDGSTALAYDLSNDGLVYRAAGCLSGGGACIQAAIVYIYVADATTSIEEYVVYPLNAP